jgi:hypothetical protein
MRHRGHGGDGQIGVPSVRGGDVQPFGRHMELLAVRGRQVLWQRKGKLHAVRGGIVHDCTHVKTSQIGTQKETKGKGHRPTVFE